MNGAPPPHAAAVFGGSFDPPHVAHVAAVRYLAADAGFERVLVVPVFAHAFGKHLAPYEDRVEMCRLAFGPIRGAEVSRVEERLGAPSRSLATVTALSEQHAGVPLRLVVGSDVLGETHAWYRWDDLVRLAPPFVLLRDGFPAGEAHDAELPDVSSTHVRELLNDADAGNRRTRDAELRALLPEAVLAYVRAHGLYR
jgi:nicotinate-nucleotide adenylyltransferase